MPFQTRTRRASPWLPASLLSIVFPLMLPSGEAAQANYDEGRVPEYTLPGLLDLPGGGKVESISQWENLQRPRILYGFESEVYGQAPQDPPSIDYQVDRVVPGELDGGAVIKEATVFFSGRSGGPSLHLLLFLPGGPGPHPAFLGLNFKGNHTVHPSPKIRVATSWVGNDERLGIRDNRANATNRGHSAGRWPVDRILERGYALATAYYGDIDPDFDDQFRNGIHALYHEGRSPEPHQWGSISAWAWGLSRALDYLEEEPGVDAGRVSLIGHSRLGKTALWAGARDPRFALVISNNSGCGGAALSRRQFGETVLHINQRFPHWFCDNFNRYNHRVEQLPVDQHMLIALMAPRPVYVASATEDRWADPRGEYLAAREAAPAYRLYGLEGLEGQDPPPADTSAGGHVGYHSRTGGHDIKAWDWERYMDFADRHLKEEE